MVLPLLVLLLSALLLPPLYFIYFIYKPPRLLIRYFQRRWPDVLWHVATKKKVVALTIDDAPSTHTREILDVLRANHATATFFVIGSQVDEGHGITLRDLVCAKNELGNHAMHDEPSRALSDDVLRDQIRQVEERIRQAYCSADSTSSSSVVGSNNGPIHYYFRPGSGFFSSRMQTLLKDLGYQLVLGSVYPHDPQVPYPRVNASHILGSVRPGSIIICHDRRNWTVPMLRRVLPELARRGYRVVTVTQLIKEASN